MSSTNQALGPNAPVTAPPGPSPLAPERVVCSVASIVPSLPVPSTPTPRIRRLLLSVSVNLVTEPLTSVTCTFTFEAAHRLPWHSGKCRNLHGHSYRLDVTVAGPLDDNGVVIDFDRLREIVDHSVIASWDHRDLNEVLDNPTAELLAQPRLGDPHRCRAPARGPAPLGDGHLIGRAGRRERQLSR